MVIGGCPKTEAACSGSLGGTAGGPDIPGFDVDNYVFGQFSSTLADIPIAFRKVGHFI